MNENIAAPVAIRNLDVADTPPLENLGGLAASAKLRPNHRAKLTVTGLFAGVGGLEEGFRRAGHTSTLLCEVDQSARHVLARHFPDAEIAPDINELRSLPASDVLTAGFPCQDLSQVGRRQGISGPNSGLIEKVFQLLRNQARRPRWVVLENVPFMLSLERGKAIRTIADALEEMGFAWAYRTIDARAFGLPQRRRRVVILASQTDDPRSVLFGDHASAPSPRPRVSHACGFYWTKGNTGLGWAVDAVPPLKGGSALHIPSPPAIWFPRRRLIAVPAIEDAERLQGFEAGWTRLDDVDKNAGRKRWRMVGNAVSVPMAKWIAERLTEPVEEYQPSSTQGLPGDRGWPGAAWSFGGQRAGAAVSEWPVVVDGPHLSAFLRHPLKPLSKKATQGFHSRLVKSGLRFDEAFARDLAYHINHAEAG
jgi:DNA (cytosine-5)-methyltransferase 1